MLDAMARAAVFPRADTGGTEDAPRGHGLIFLAPLAGLAIWLMLAAWFLG